MEGLLSILIFCEGWRHCLKFRLIEGELQLSMIKHFSTRKKYVYMGDKEKGAK